MMPRWLALFLLLLQAQTSPAFQTRIDDQHKSTEASAPIHPNQTSGVSLPNASGHSGQIDSSTDSANTISLRKYCGVIRGYSGDKSELELADRTAVAETAAGPEPCDPGPAVEIHIQGQALKEGLASWKAGDQVIATVSVAKNSTAESATLQDVQAQVLPVNSPWEPAIALFSFPVLVILLTMLSRNVRKLIFIGQDGRWSNSTTQMTLWFTLWVSAYIATFILRWTSSHHFLGSITTPSTLLALSGLSGLTFAGAKGITANKVANQVPTSIPGTLPTVPGLVGSPAPLSPASDGTPAMAAPAATPVVPGTRAFPNGKRNHIKASRTSLADLLKDDRGNFDFGDFQMLVMTFVAVISYGVAAYHFLTVLEARASVSLPDVDMTVLAMFGVGQGAYLAKKASTGIDQ